MTDAETIANSLGGSRKIAGGYIARCPVPGHGRGRGDKTPSLSLANGTDGQLLAHCHAGCPSDAVFDALRQRGHWNSGKLPQISNTSK